MISKHASEAFYCVHNQDGMLRRRLTKGDRKADDMDEQALLVRFFDWISKMGSSSESMLFRNSFTPSNDLVTRSCEVSNTPSRLENKKSSHAEIESRGL